MIPGSDGLRRQHVERTTDVSDPSLTLTHDSLKIFSAFYVRTSIGISVELARELGVGFVKEREARHAANHARHHKDDPPETKSPR